MIKLCAQGLEGDDQSSPDLDPPIRRDPMASVLSPALEGLWLSPQYGLTGRPQAPQLGQSSSSSGPGHGGGQAAQGLGLLRSGTELF